MPSITQKTIGFIQSILGKRSESHRLYKDRHILVAKGLPEDTCNVISFRTEGGLNRCYHVDVLLTSRRHDIELESLLRTPVFAFTENQKGSFVTFRGTVAECEQLGAVGENYHYRFQLAPKLWLLERTSHNQVFLDMTTTQILEAVLKDGGLMSDEFEFRLMGHYDHPWEYVCQYNESHFSFFRRWLEREGMYFFFEANDYTDRLIITDTMHTHQPSSADRPLIYRPSTGMEPEEGTLLLHSFSASCSQTPENLIIKDYNYRHPSLDLTGKAIIDKDGHGDVYIYGHHLQSPEDSKRLATVRAEELLCGKRTFRGTSNSPFLRPGLTFQVKEHFRKEMNRTYLVTSISHEGEQPQQHLAGLDSKAQSSGVWKPSYRNSFTAIPADVQYRPPLATPRPRFHGVINAVIDASTPGQLPDLDDQGRYKVVLPFDLSGKKDGKASAWIRMAQPYAGENHGMHFPLKKGTEVLLTFVDGDPDRPIIAGAVPNPVNPSQVLADIQSQCRITTAGGNLMHIEDLKGAERMKLYSPQADSMIGLGASEASPSEKPTDKSKGINLYTKGTFSVTGASEYKLIMGQSSSATIGCSNKILIGTSFSASLAASSSIFYGTQVGYTGGCKYDFSTANKYSDSLEEVKYGQNSVEFHAGAMDGAIPLSMRKYLGVVTGSVLASSAFTGSAVSAANENNLTDEIGGIATASIGAIIANLVPFLSKPGFPKRYSTNQYMDTDGMQLNGPRVDIIGGRPDLARLSAAELKARHQNDKNKMITLDATGVTISVGKHTILVTTAHGIKINSPKAVTIEDLKVTNKGDFFYKGKKASILDVLKVKN